MRTEHLEYVVDIYETQSFSQTAENFLTSHQVVSKAVSNLEHELNVQIFERNYNGVIFTDIGLRIYEYAKEMLESRDKMLQTIAESNAQISIGRLNICIAPRFANDFFMGFYNDYAKKNPKLQMILKNISYNYILNNEIDTETIIFLPMVEETLQSARFKEIIQKHDLTYEVILKQPLGYCVSVKSPYYHTVAEQAGKIVDVLNFPVVVHNYFMEDQDIFDLPSQRNFYLVDNFDMQRKMVRKGTHVAILLPFEYKWLFKQDNDVKFFDTISNNDFYYVVLYKRIELYSNNISKFLNKLKEQINKADILSIR